MSYCFSASYETLLRFGFRACICYYLGLFIVLFWSTTYQLHRNIFGVNLGKYLKLPPFPGQLHVLCIVLLPASVAVAGVFCPSSQAAAAVTKRDEQYESLDTNIYPTKVPTCEQMQKDTSYSAINLFPLVNFCLSSICKHKLAFWVHETQEENRPKNIFLSISNDALSHIFPFQLILGQVAPQ